MFGWGQYVRHLPGCLVGVSMFAIYPGVWLGSVCSPFTRVFGWGQYVHHLLGCSVGVRMFAIYPGVRLGSVCSPFTRVFGWGENVYHLPGCCLLDSAVDWGRWSVTFEGVRLMCWAVWVSKRERVGLIQDSYLCL